MKNFSLKRKLRIASSVMLITLLTVGLGSCQEKSKTTYVDSSLLWEISGNELAKPSYLFGTIHIYDTTVFKIPQTIFTLLDASDRLALELDLDKVNPMQMMQSAMTTYPDSTLNKLVSEKTLNKIKENPVVAMMIQQMGDQFYNFKPFFISSFLMIDDITKPVTGVDTDLQQYAKKTAKPIMGIETMDEQLAAINSLSLREQAEMLEQGLEEYDDPKEAIKVLLNAYKMQDLAAMVKEMEKSNTNPLFTDRFIAHRNSVMAERISEHIKSNNETLFAGVGALHLPDFENVKGVVSLLKEMGYEVKAVELTF